MKARMKARMKVGDSRQATRTFTAEDAARYAALTGAPVRPGEVPEPLVGALFSYLLGVELPGFGTNYLKQDSRFLGPAPLGEPLTARVEITALRPEKNLVDLRTTCRDAAGTLLADGRALVYVADVRR